MGKGPREGKGKKEEEEGECHAREGKGPRRDRQKSTGGKSQKGKVRT